VETNNERAALFLIAKNANINAKDNKEQTPLHCAAAKGLTDMCRFLLDFQANIRAKDTHCWTALHHAVDGNYIETATLLIKRGVDIHAEDHRHGRTCLHLAAERGYAEMAEMLIIRGADMCATGDAFFSKTPLHISCLHGHDDVTEVLIRKGADVDALSGLLDKGPLHFAAEEGHVNCVKQLLQGKADPNRHGNHTNGYSPIHLAVLKDHWHVVEAFLVSEKLFSINVNLPGKFSIVGASPLHLACQYGHTHIVQLLMDAPSVNREAQDTNHRTPLHIACKYGHYGIADLLMEFGGCDYTAKSLDGKTPIDLISDPVEKDRLKLLCFKLDLVKKYQDEQARRRREVEAERKAEAEALAAAKAKEEQERIRLAAERHQEWRRQLTLVSDVAGEIESFQRLAAEYFDQSINDLLVEIDTTVINKEQAAKQQKNVRSPGHEVGEVPSVTQATALTRAAYRGFYDVVQALLHWKDIDIDFQEQETGNTALHYAADHGFRDIVELLLLHGAKNYLMNKKGQVPANLARTTALREIIRNVRLIAKRHLFQDAVLEEIYHRQALLAAELQQQRQRAQEAAGSEEGFASGAAKDNAAVPTTTGELTLGLVVFEENLSHPETLRQIMDTTTPMRSNAPGESGREFSELNSLLASPHKHGSGKAELKETTSSSLKLPPLPLPGAAASPSPLQRHLAKHDAASVGGDGGVAMDFSYPPSVASPPPKAGSSSKTANGSTYFPSMGPQHGAFFTPNFHFPAASAPAAGGKASASVLSSASSKGNAASTLSRQMLELEQQKAHVPFAQRIFKDRQGFIEAVTGMGGTGGDQSTLPPLRGPLAMHDLDNHAMDDLYSVHSLNQLGGGGSAIGSVTGDDDDDRLHRANEDFVEVNLASFLAHHYDSAPTFTSPSKGKASHPQQHPTVLHRLQQKLETKYGAIPISFGGCRRDLFYVQLRAKHYHQPAIPRFKDEQYTTVYHLQRSYLPTAFDTSVEFEEVRDFLWLLGHPYHVALMEELKYAAEPPAEGMAATAHSVHRVSTASQALLSPCFRGFDADTAARRDKRSFLYDAAVAMNLLHDLFTKPTAETVVVTSDGAASSAATLTTFLLAQATKQQQATKLTSSHESASSPSPYGHTFVPFASSYSIETTASVAASLGAATRAAESIALPKNLHAEDLPHLHRFAAVCRDVLTIILTIYDTNFPAYLEGCVAGAEADPSSVTAGSPPQPSSSPSSTRKSLAKEPATGPPRPSSMRLTIEQERLVVQALRDEIFYLQQYGFLDEALVATLHQQLLPCCTLFALEFLLGKEASPYAMAQHPVEASVRRKAKKTKKGTAAKDDGDAGDEAQLPLTQDPLKEVWAGLLLNPPRSRRQAIDAVFELAAFLMQQAEVSYPPDAIRAHLWAQQARQLLQEYKEHSALPAGVSSSPIKAMHNRSTPAKATAEEGHDESSTIADDQSSVALMDPSSLTVSPAEVARAALQLWLEDMALVEYERYFVGLGFKLLEDFQELSEEDCYRYFPFIKVGDMRRLAKRCDQLSDGIVRDYLKRTEKMQKEWIEREKALLVKKQQERADAKAAAAARAAVTRAAGGGDAAIALDDDMSSMVSLSARLHSRPESPRPISSTIVAEETGTPVAVTTAATDGSSNGGAEDQASVGDDSLYRDPSMDEIP
jgi:ankyrin repeat protein